MDNRNPVICVALGLDSFSKGQWVACSVLVLVLWNPGEIRRATTYNAPSDVPFSEVNVPGEGPVVDLLGMEHRTALSAQTKHRRPIAEPLLFRRGASAHQAAIQSFVEGHSAAAGLWAELEKLGFEMVLVWDRIGRHEAVEARVQQALGDPVAPGVYRLSSRIR